MNENIAHRLREAAARLSAERVSVAGLLQAHGPAAHGSLLLLLAVPCLLPVPGTGTVLGLGVLALAVSMWRGQSELALPARVARLEMSQCWARRVLSTLATIYAVAARVARARHGWMVREGAWRWLAAAVALMAVLLILPIPFGNVLPAAALILLGLGLSFRDGIVVAAGAVVGVLAAGVMFTLVVLAAGWGWSGAMQLLA